MDCKEIQDNLSAYIDRELSPPAEESLRKHLGECDQCALQYAKLLKGWLDLDVWEDVTPPDRMRRKILDSVRPQKKTVPLRAVLSAAAVLLFVLGITVYYSGQKGPSKQEHLAGSQLNAQTAAVGDVSEDEIIANLLIFEEADFIEALDELVRIGDLPFAEEPSDNTKDPERSSLELFLT